MSCRTAAAVGPIVIWRVIVVAGRRRVRLIVWGGFLHFERMWVASIGELEFNFGVDRHISLLVSLCNDSSFY